MTERMPTLSEASFMVQEAGVNGFTDLAFDLLGEEGVQIYVGKHHPKYAVQSRADVNPINVVLDNIPYDDLLNDQLVSRVFTEPKSADGQNRLAVPVIPNHKAENAAVAMYGELTGPKIVSTLDDSVSSWLIDTHVQAWYDHPGFFYSKANRLLRLDTLPLLVTIIEEARRARPIRKSYPLIGRLCFMSKPEEHLEKTYEFLKECERTGSFC